MAPIPKDCKKSNLGWLQPTWNLSEHSFEFWIIFNQKKTWIQQHLWEFSHHHRLYLVFFFEFLPANLCLFFDSRGRPCSNPTQKTHQKNPPKKRPSPSPKPLGIRNGRNLRVSKSGADTAMFCTFDRLKGGGLVGSNPAFRLLGWCFFRVVFHKNQQKKIQVVGKYQWSTFQKKTFKPKRAKMGKKKSVA